MDQNKRLSPRFLFFEPVAYGFPESIVNGSIAGNISIGGISLKVQEFVAVGSVLELQLSFDQTPKVIWAKAIVVRTREVLSEDCYEIGLKFITEEECIKEAVGKYIAGQSK